MFSGSIVALVTPMSSAGSVDFPALDRLIDRHIDAGTHAIVPVGTTGESATLDVSEHLSVIEHVIERVDGRIPIIAGTGANATAEAIELTREAKARGADGCLLVTPYYNKPTQEGLFRHYVAVAEAVDVPLVLYNVPSRTGCDMLPETVGRLASIPQIVGVKEASGDVSRVTAIRELSPDDFAILSGEDACTFEMLKLGARGVISVTANAAPVLMSRFCDAYLEGDVEEAEAIDERLQPLHAMLFVESNPIPVKWALHELGLIDAGIRLPLTPLAEQFRQPLAALLRELELG